VSIDPDLAAILLAVMLGAVPGLVTGRKALAQRRRLKGLCAACGRRFVHGQRQCDCDAS
jgi:hypothetical protein